MRDNLGHNDCGRSFAEEGEPSAIKKDASAAVNEVKLIRTRQRQGTQSTCGRRLAIQYTATSLQLFSKSTVYDRVYVSPLVSGQVPEFCLWYIAFIQTTPHYSAPSGAFCL